MQTTNTNLRDLLHTVRNKLTPIKTLFSSLPILLNSKEEKGRSVAIGHIRSWYSAGAKSLSDLKWIVSEASHLGLQKKLSEFEPLMEEFQQLVNETDDTAMVGRAKALQALLEKQSTLIEDTIKVLEEEE